MLHGSLQIWLAGKDEIKPIAIIKNSFECYQVKILAIMRHSEPNVFNLIRLSLDARWIPSKSSFCTLKDARGLNFLKRTLTCLIEMDYQIKSGLYDKDYLSTSPCWKSQQETSKSFTKFISKIVENALRYDLYNNKEMRMRKWQLFYQIYLSAYVTLSYHRWGNNALLWQAPSNFLRE